MDLLKTQFFFGISSLFSYTYIEIQKKIVDDQTKNKSKKLQILADKILFLLKV